MDTTTAGLTSETAALSSAVEEMPRLLNLSGRLYTVRFRGRRVAVVAKVDSTESALRAPITDVVSLELASGSGDRSSWPCAVELEAVLVSGRDPVRAVQRASRWASYSSRVAIVPEERINDQAMLEAQLRGVWLVAARPPQVVVAGETGPAPGSTRGLLHRLLDELILAAEQGASPR